MESSNRPFPDWKKIFADRPDLDPPGYAEACSKIAAGGMTIEVEIARARMLQINSDRQKEKTKNRAVSKKRAGK